MLAFLKSLNEALAVAQSQRVHPPFQQSANTLDRRTTSGAPPRQSGRNRATRCAWNASGRLYTRHGLVGSADKRDNVSGNGRHLCQIGNTGSAGIRTGARKPRSDKRQRSQSRKTPSDQSQSTCRARAPFRDARSVAHSCSPSPTLWGNVPSAASNSIPASSVPTSIPRAGSSARSPLRSGFRGKTRATSARSTPCA